MSYPTSNKWISFLDHVVETTVCSEEWIEPVIKEAALLCLSLSELLFSENEASVFADARIDVRPAVHPADLRLLLVGRSFGRTCRPCCTSFPSNKWYASPSSRYGIHSTGRIPVQQSLTFSE